MMHVNWIKNEVGDFPGGPKIKNLPASVEDAGSFHGLGLFTYCGAAKPVCHKY